MLHENLGFYLVNSKSFTNKIQAILFASETNQEISWNYCDDVFNGFNWKIEPELPIDEYYRLRAKQIRDSYDYVVIRCSGGADSTNVLYSFLNNNIFPDEVVGEAPLSGLSNWDFNCKDTRMINTVSEFKFAQIPLLHKIKTNYPNIKVQQIDTFNRIIKPKSHDWLINCNDGIDAHASFEGTMYENENLNKLAEQGKRIAIVTGTDKPYISADSEGNVYLTMVDLPLNYLKQPFREAYPNVHRVTFYWTPDFPQVISKMGHVIAKKLFGKNRDFNLLAAMIAKNSSNIPNSNFNKAEILSMFSRPVVSDYSIKKNLEYNPNNIYGRGICKYIYPSTFDSTVFQAEKMNQNQTFFGAQQDWIRILHKNLPFIDVINHDFKEIYSKVNPKFLNEYGTGFKYFHKIHSLGKLSDFTNR